MSGVETFFGVAAGALGVAGFALQLAESVKKLKDFCDRVRDAPSDLEELVGDLEMTRNIHDSMSASAFQQLGVDPTLPQQAAKRCQRAVDGIASVVNELWVALPHGRIRVSLKTVLKNNKLQRPMLQLDRRKADLHFAHSLYTSALFVRNAQQSGQRILDQIDVFAQQTGVLLQAQHIGMNVMQSGQADAEQLAQDRLAHALRAINDTQATLLSSSHAEYAALGQHTSASKAEIEALRQTQQHVFASLHIDQTQVVREVQQVHTLLSDRSHTDQQRTLQHFDTRHGQILAAIEGLRERLRSSSNDGVKSKTLLGRTSPTRVNVKPAWQPWLPEYIVASSWRYQLHLFTKVWDISVAHALSGWQFSFRHFRVLPDDHQIYGFLEEKDAEGIQEMIMSGKLSIYDRTYCGSLFVVSYAPLLCAGRY